MKKGGFVNSFLKGVGVFVGLGIILALMRAFHWDIFGIVEWIFSWLSYVVDKISDWFTSLPTFQKLLKKPA